MKRLTEYTIPETGFSVVSEEKYKRILMEEKPSVEKVYNRLKKIEDILGDEYDLNRLRVIMDAEQHGGLIVGYGPGDPGEPGELGVMEEVAADNVVVVSAESAGIAPCRQGLRRDMESPEPFPAISGHATGET